MSLSLNYTVSLFKSSFLIRVENRISGLSHICHSTFKLQFCSDLSCGMATSLVFFIIADFKQLLNFITKYVYTQKQVYMEKIGSNLWLLERFMKHLSYLLLHWLKFIRINDIYIFIETITSVSSYVDNALR